MKFINSIRRLLSPGARGFWIMLAVVVPAIPAIGLSVSAVLSQEFQCWLIGSGPNGETGSTTIRNLGLIIAGLVALPLAVWRGYVAHRQSNTAQEQVDKSQQQVETAQQGLRNERYQKAAEMLGSAVLSVRMAGIYALQRLAEEYPEEYHVQIMQLFCAFVRHPTEDEKYEARLESETMDIAWRDNREGLRDKPMLREDVEAIMQAIRKRSQCGIALERKEEFILNLTKAKLPHINLIGADLSNANLWETNLFLAYLNKSKLIKANFFDADLAGAGLTDANISGALLSGVQGLTQVQLDMARADPSNPPRTGRIIDARTGHDLIWRGGQGAPLEEEE